MKRYIPIVLLVFFNLTVFAQNKTLLFFAEKGEEFSVVYNNVVINDKPASFVKLFGLHNGDCSVSILFKDYPSANIHKVINLSQASEHTYIIRKYSNSYVLTPLYELPVVRKGVSPGNSIYYSSTNLLSDRPADPVTDDPCPKPVEQAECDKPSLNDRAFVKVKYEIDSKKSLDLKKQKARDVISSNCLLASQVAQILKLIPDANEKLELAKYAYAHTYDYKNYSVVANALMSQTDRKLLNQFISGEEAAEPVVVVEVASGDCPDPATEEDFRQGKGAIAQQTFDDDKMMVAKQFLSNHCLQVNQVIELIKLFTFESEKLEFAKYAYTHTFDRKNYYLLNNSFTFSNSKEELARYINSVK